MENKIKIISARHGYENIYPNDARKWKINAFLEINQFFEKDIITNLICLGDSHIEIDAAHVLAKKFDQSFIKTIKFRESPSPAELLKQHKLVLRKMKMIYVSMKNLTIRLQKKRKPSL